MRTQCESQESLQEQLRQMQQRIAKLEEEKQLLQEEKGQLESLLWSASQNTLSFITQMDQDLRVVRIFSHRGLEVCEQYIGKTIADFSEYDGFTELSNLLKKALTTGERQCQDVKVSSPDGGSTYMITAEPIRNLAHQVEGVALIATDISEWKKVDQVLLEAERLSAVGELSARVAHDFKNILAVIMGSAQLLQVKMKKNEELCSEYLPRTAMIIEQSKKGVMVATDMLETARPNLKESQQHHPGGE